VIESGRTEPTDDDILTLEKIVVVVPDGTVTFDS
jgi:hypothetical protein